MNAVEIEAAVSELAAQPIDAGEFPYAFLAAFGNKDTTLERLRKGNTNKSDVRGGVLQRNNIHIAVCESGSVGATLKALRVSPETTNAKAKFILATDGLTLEAEDLNSGEIVASAYADFADHFGFFLPLAGISTVKEIKENPIDIKATGRLNKLYVELLKNNPDWAKHHHDMNHFMARLIFCFFAEDTDIFDGTKLFTRTIDQMSERDASNLHEVMGAIFRAMDIKPDDRGKAELPVWASQFPYVNGSLFSGDTQVPRFTRIARTYLIRAGELTWKMINPDIFGSMIQAVADDEERGALGMHYTSVPNILKVLNPLFLDNLNAQLAAVGDNKLKLLNLRKRIARIRVFDPACGSGNFLVIAYKRMRAVEAEINIRRGEANRKSDIPLTNFRGIEIRDFAAEIARLALVIAEYQCDVLYRGQKDAIKDILPLKKENWITSGNALRLDWLAICPPTGTSVKVTADDLFEIPLRQAEIDFENEGGETYICGNPPYLGSTWQDQEQKADLKVIFDGRTRNWKLLDYVAGWFMKASDYGTRTESSAAFVSTNSICQGQGVPILWRLIFATGHEISFAYTSFKWANLASHNAGVTVVIVGISRKITQKRKLYSVSTDSAVVNCKDVDNINAYLVAGQDIIVDKAARPLSNLSEMLFGSKPVDGGWLLLTPDEIPELGLTRLENARYIRRIYGSEEFIDGKPRYCIWIDDRDSELAEESVGLRTRIMGVRAVRLKSKKAATRRGAGWPHRFDERRQTGKERIIVVPAVSSETREYLPCGLLSVGAIISNRNFGIFDAPLWNLAILVSRVHWIWIDAVCGKLEMRFNYSNTLGWNTFPVPTLTDRNKADLTRCAEEVLLGREHYFPATIADMYDPDRMDKEFPRVREAHERNDEVLERIYIGRRFKNDTERLEKLFDMYTKMMAAKSQIGKRVARERGVVAP